MRVKLPVLSIVSSLGSAINPFSTVLKEKGIFFRSIFGAVFTSLGNSSLPVKERGLTQQLRQKETPYWRQFTSQDEDAEEIAKSAKFAKDERKKAPNYCQTNTPPVCSYHQKSPPLNALLFTALSTALLPAPRLSCAPLRPWVPRVSLSWATCLLSASRRQHLHPIVAPSLARNHPSPPRLAPSLSAHPHPFNKQTPSSQPELASRCKKSRWANLKIRTPGSCLLVPPV